MAAFMAILRRVFRLYFNERLTSPFCLVRQVVKEKPPRCVRDGFGETMILRHIGDFQAFNANHSKLIDYFTAFPMSEIPSFVRNALVNAGGYFAPMFALFASFGGSRELAAHPSEFNLLFTKEARRFYLGAVAQDGKRLQPGVYPYGNAFSRLHSFVGFDGKASKPLACRDADNSTSLNLSANISMEFNFYFAYLAKIEFAVRSYLEAKLSIGKRIISIGRKKARIARLISGFNPLEESSKREVEPSQGVLKDLRVDAAQFRSVLFYIRQLRNLTIAINGLIVSTISIAAFLKPCIVKLAANVERFYKDGFLFARGKDSKSEPFLHRRRIYHFCFYVNPIMILTPM